MLANKHVPSGLVIRVAFGLAPRDLLALLVRPDRPVDEAVHWSAVLAVHAAPPSLSTAVGPDVVGASSIATLAAAGDTGSLAALDKTPRPQAPPHPDLPVAGLRPRRRACPPHRRPRLSWSSRPRHGQPDGALRGASQPDQRAAAMGRRAGAVAAPVIGCSRSEGARKTRRDSASDHLGRSAARQWVCNAVAVFR